MDPFPLKTARLVLDQPISTDIDAMAGYCAEPVFERFLTTPWPYEREHAAGFVEEYVPQGWANGTEWTWAIRETAGGPLIGVIGVRFDIGSVGFWLGAPHRGRGLLPEALDAVIEAFFARTDRDVLLWECVVGNVASLRAAEKTGFRFTGERPGDVPGRNGERVMSWTGEIRREDDRLRKPGWPSIAGL